MDYSAHYDYFISFDAVLDENGDLIQYELVEISDNISRISKAQASQLIGKNMLELIDEYQDDFLGLKDIYHHIGKNAVRKFEKYMESCDRWYLVNIFNRNSNLLVLYTDITVMKNYLVNVSEAIENNILSRSYKDGLTGLYNKDYFKVELSRLDTERQFPISIIIGDLNGLKLINDAFGYHMGDEAITTAADILVQAFRSEDIISRFGGDEFVILLPKTSGAEAMERVHEIKKLFLALPLDFLQLSMSFGIGTKEKTSQNIMDVFKRAEEKMYFNKLKESKIAKAKVINSLKIKLMANTTETEEHHHRLKELSYIFGERVGLSEKEQEELDMLCEYHDIGAISIPNHIYYKQEELNDEDWHTIKRHCEIGYHIMKSVTFDKPIAEHILMHHERWDGRGYPRFLKGEETPLVVRLFNIVDAYEAMVNNRPYRQRLTPNEAMEEIVENSGGQFEPYLVEEFVSLMKNDMEEKNIV